MKTTPGFWPYSRWVGQKYFTFIHHRIATTSRSPKMQSSGWNLLWIQHSRNDI